MSDAKQEVSELANREQGLLHLIFDVEYHPALLPEGTPPDIVSAWTRLHMGARRDIRLIQDWIGDE